jgi:hypothetical protein
MALDERGQVPAAQTGPPARRVGDLSGRCADVLSPCDFCPKRRDSLTRIPAEVPR